MSDRSRTLLVITGASEWPHEPHVVSSEAFSVSAKALRDALGERGLVGVPDANMLWLFEEDVEPLGIYERITAFFEERFAALDAPKGHGALIMFAYIGHGAFFGSRNSYCLLLRNTRPPLREETSLRVTSVHAVLQKVAPMSARLVMLDACFAGAAGVGEFQGSLDEAVGRKVEDALRDDRGVAVLCASSADNPARLDLTAGRTMFTGELVDALRDGDPETDGLLTPRRLCELVRARLLERYGDDAPLPEVHSPVQTRRDVAAIPLFPNAHSTSGPSGAAVRRPTTQRDAHASTGAATRKPAARRPAWGLVVKELTCVRHQGPVLKVDFSTTGRLLATGGRDGTARVWDLPGGGEVWRMHHPHAVTGLAMLPDPARVATAVGDKLVRLLDLKSGKQLDPLEFKHAVYELAASADGRYLAVLRRKTLSVLDLEHGVDVRELSIVDEQTDGTSRTLRPRSFALSKAGDRLGATSNWGGAFVWRLPDGHQVGNLTHSHGVWRRIHAISFSADASLVATGGGDKSARVREMGASRFKKMARLPHSSPVFALAFSPDGKLLATGSKDGNVHVWSLPAGREVCVAKHGGAVRSAAFSPDGALLATASDDETVRVWEPDR